MATRVLGALPAIFDGRVPLTSAVADAANLYVNGVFVGDSNADGGANNWNIGLPTSRSLVAGTSPLVGNWQHVEGDGSGLTNLYQDIASPGAITGHTIAIAARVQLTSGALRLRLQMTGQNIDVGPFSIPFEGIVRIEAVVPSGATQVRANFLTSTGAAQSFSVAQVTGRDRTTLAT